MIEDFATHLEEARFETDAWFIGAGAAGITESPQL
jgi:hypothetical protein